jgi:anti-sigma factor RsiW
MSDKNRGQQLNNPSAGLSEGAVAEMLPAYVLGALEMDEMLAVDDFLAAHPALLVRVAELEATADQLALAAPEVEAPAAAKAGLMGRVQADASVRSMLSAMETAAMETAAARPILAQPRQAEAALPAPALQPSLVVPRPPQREAPRRRVG